MPTRDEQLARAKKPAEDAMRLHPFYKGKVQMMPKCAVRDLSDFAIWYTPGVAAPRKAIQANPELVYEHTNKANTVAIVSDGTRVLGLGDIGPEAGLPVMEGKALLFKFLGGVDAVPLCLKTKDPDEFIRTVKLLEPSFGAINLEDIAQRDEISHRNFGYNLDLFGKGHYGILILGSQVIVDDNIVIFRIFLNNLQEKIDLSPFQFFEYSTFYFIFPFVNLGI